MLRTPPPPARGNLSGRITRGIGALWMLGGAAIALGTATGRLKWQFSDPSVAYLIAGIVAAYGLLRYLRASMDARNSVDE